MATGGLEVTFDSSEVVPLPELHVSDIAAFLQCRRAWNWSSRFRGNLQPKRLYMPFFTGRVVHYCLERYHMYGEPTATTVDGAIALETVGMREHMLPEELEELDGQIDLLKGMLAHYELWEARLEGPFSMKNLEFLTVEQEFHVPIVHPTTGEIFSGATFGGKIDGLVRRRDNGDVYIIEWKTTTRKDQRAKMLANDKQASQYLQALKLALPDLADDIKGLLYTLLVKKTPVMPKVLANGFLSTDIRYQSFDSYERFITIHHNLGEWEENARRDFVIGHYGAQLMALYRSQASGNIFFERHVVTRNEHALQLARQDLWDLAVDMTNPNLPMIANDGFHCSYCLFQEPCIALQNGLPLAPILGVQYGPRDNGVVGKEMDTED